MDKYVLYEEVDDMCAIEAQLKYDLYIAEEVLKMTSRRLEKQVLSESTNAEVLNEAFADIIQKYLRTVTDSMQKAWNNFKNKIDYVAIEKAIKGEEKYLESDFKMKLPTDYLYPELNEWNSINENCTIGDNLLSTANYAQMSQYLESPEKFLDQYYKEYVEQENGKQLKFVEVFEKRCFSKASEQQVVDKNLIAQYVAFLEGYKDQIGQIQTDIDAINQVNSNMDELIKQIGGANNVTAPTNNRPEPQQQATAASAIMKGSNYVLEADDQPKPENTNKFRNADPNAPDPTKNSSKDRQNIVNYYKAMTSILTAKMRTCNKVKNNSLRIVMNFVRLQGGYKIAKKVEVQQTRTTNNTATQVK